MTAKLVCRLLTVDGRLLGWCAHDAHASGDGFLRASSPVVLTVDEDGQGHELSIHWADLNVETVVPFPAREAVSRGQALTLFQPKAAMVLAGSPPAKRLPPVTMRTQSAVSVPVGQLGATGAA